MTRRRKKGAEQSRPARDEDDLHLPLPPKAKAEADHYNHHPNYIHPSIQKNQSYKKRREYKRRSSIYSSTENRPTLPCKAHRERKRAESCNKKFVQLVPSARRRKERLIRSSSMARRPQPMPWDHLTATLLLLVVVAAAAAAVVKADDEKCSNPCGNPCGEPCVYASPPPPVYYPPPAPVYSPPPPAPEYYPPPIPIPTPTTPYCPPGYTPATPYTPGYNPTPSGGGGGWFTPPYTPGGYNPPTPGTLYPQDPGFQPNAAPARAGAAPWRAVIFLAAASAVACACFDL